MAKFRCPDCNDVFPMRSAIKLICTTCEEDKYEEAINVIKGLLPFVIGGGSQIAKELGIDSASGPTLKEAQDAVRKFWRTK